MTPLCLAALKARVNVVRMLLSRRALLEKRGDLLQSSLHCAVLGGNIECISMVLQHGAQIEDWRTCPPIERSLLLLQPPPPPWPKAFAVLTRLRLEGIDHFQPLHIAVLNGDLHATAFLLKQGASSNSLDRSGATTGSVTPLMLAAAVDHAEVLRLMIGHGAEVSLANYANSMTALHYAAGKGGLHCVRSLLDSGVDINATSQDDATALLHAVKCRKNDAAVYLLSRGADFTTVDSSGHSALDYAVDKGLGNVANILAVRGAEFSSASNSYSVIRLLHVSTYEFQRFAVFDAGVQPPVYATLSHQWGQSELIYDSVVHVPAAERREAVEKGSDTAAGRWSKVRDFTTACRRYDLEWAWMDSVCISRDNESELEKSIANLMTWHDRAAKHFIYLSDVVSGKSDLHKSGLFQRSWMLQELLSNSSVSTHFFSRDWEELGTRASLSNELSEIMDIRPEHLHDYKTACVAAKLSWGASLKAGRPEDLAYAMLRILKVDMTTSYGEGEQRAFQRLQERFIEISADESIFAWDLPAEATGPYGQTTIGLLAPSIRCFAGKSHIELSAPPTSGKRFHVTQGRYGPGIVFTQNGLSGRTQEFARRRQNQLDVYLRCGEGASEFVLSLERRPERQPGDDQWRRVGPRQTQTLRKKPVFPRASSAVEAYVPNFTKNDVWLPENWLSLDDEY